MTNRVPRLRPIRRLVASIGVVLASLAVAAQSRSPVDLANAPIAPGAIRLPYGADPLQFGELRLPAGTGPHPLAIVIHGGCWVSSLGRMDPRGVAIDNMRPMAAALTEAGIATWNVEYRRVGHEGGGWPGTYRDVALAADTVRRLAKTHPIDVTRVISIGHSAGGHLAIWLAARHRIPATSELFVKDPLAVAGAVSLDGPGDLRTMRDAQQQICGRPVIDELMGGTPAEQPDRYRAASPAELLPIGVPVESLTGKSFGSLNAAYETAAIKGGDRFRATLIPTGGHFIYIDPQSDAWPQVLAAVRNLIR
jgi:acetyl esterase/lipase